MTEPRTVDSRCSSSRCSTTFNTDTEWTALLEKKIHYGMVRHQRVGIERTLKLKQIIITLRHQVGRHSQSTGRYRIMHDLERPEQTNQFHFIRFRRTFWFCHVLLQTARQIYLSKRQTQNTNRWNVSRKLAERNGRVSNFIYFFIIVRRVNARTSHTFCSSQTERIFSFISFKSIRLMSTHRRILRIFLDCSKIFLTGNQSSSLNSYWFDPN